jgi:hypothetical protein
METGTAMLSCPDEAPVGLESSISPDEFSIETPAVIALFAVYGSTC